MINTGKLAGRTIFITGASRGIGKAIAIKAARDGANIVIAARTTEENPKLPGTIYTAAHEVEKAGGRALPCAVDIRDEEQVRAAVHDAVSRFGGIDIVVNNASAISFSSTAATKINHFDIMHQTNTRGAFIVSQECMPYLIRSEYSHILNIAPPLNLDPKWLSAHLGYTIAKYGMSMCVLGMSYELNAMSVAVNALWPRTSICTERIKALMGPEFLKRTRKVDIMADAAYAVLIREPKEFTGRFLVDDEVLTEAGVKDLDQYANDPTVADELMYESFVDIPKEKIVPFINRDIPVWKSILKERKPKVNTQKEERKISGLFEKIGPLLSNELVQKTLAIYQFHIVGNEGGVWYIDLKNGAGSCGKGVPEEEADATFAITSENFVEIFSGKMKPSTALLMGEMKISGDLSKALKLEKLTKTLTSKMIIDKL
ncbi:hydroxysteroid dehydrogenase-like protein 2 [Bactrocera neohumeralis]|uniref:hydroxysteroid dehydrogenase-like protein 2 n=1 Tax=Bactrocera neohumeralis TaxID=98809 RepID=UPI00216526F6|nr:hydroxysteroid dehydrogenase-like protein 2 [Bactrocera neohumeralis]